ncbi:MAG TPA: ankyrin repeat domain-containing protein, partial [Coxiellaceae bacterium]|nr:ankyrin repeat domain-containing protein [Coxiellaceae bacterium]
MRELAKQRKWVEIIRALSDPTSAALTPEQAGDYKDALSIAIRDTVLEVRDFLSRTHAREAALALLKGGADFNLGQSQILKDMATDGNFKLVTAIANAIATQKKTAAISKEQQTSLASDLKTALSIATNSSSENKEAEEAALALIAADADPGDYPKEHYTTLIEAARLSRLALVKAIVEKKKASAISKEAKAALAKELGVALIENSIMLTKRTDTVPTRIETINYLIEQGADLKTEASRIIKYSSAPHQSILHYAAYTNDLALINILLEHGTQLKTNSKGDTPLGVASRANSWEAFERLLTFDQIFEKNKDEAGNILCELIPALNKTIKEGHLILTVRQNPVITEKIITAIDKLLTAKPNLKIIRGNTALHLAAEVNDLGVVERLLAAGADPYQTNYLEQAAFELSSNWQVIELLLVTKPTTSWLPSAGFSSASSKLSYTKVLLRMLSVPVPQENKFDVLRVAEKLISKGASIQDMSREVGAIFHDHATALHAAVSANNLTLINFLISKNPTAVNVENSYNKAPVVIAAEMGHWDTVKILMKLSSKDTLASLLIFLAEKSFSLEVQEIVNKAIAAGVNFSYQNQYKITPLAQAILSKNKELFQILLTHSNQDIRTDALFRALKEMLDHPLSRRFYAFGADDKKDIEIEENKIIEACEQLIQAGVDTNAYFKISFLNRLTLLHLAVEIYQPKLVYALLKAGANPIAKDERGHVPFVKVRGSYKDRNSRETRAILEPAQEVALAQGSIKEKIKARQ